MKIKCRFQISSPVGRANIFPNRGIKKTSSIIILVPKVASWKNLNAGQNMSCSREPKRQLRSEEIEEFASLIKIHQFASLTKVQGSFVMLPLDLAFKQGLWGLQGIVELM